jgi:hypothetical protein
MVFRLAAACHNVARSPKRSPKLERRAGPYGSRRRRGSRHCYVPVPADRRLIAARAPGPARFSLELDMREARWGSHHLPTIQTARSAGSTRRQQRTATDDGRSVALRLNRLDGYTDRMAKPESIAQAGLVGWRKVIADSVAPRAASRGPVSEERLRAAIGAAFFLLSLYYVASTSARMIKSAQSSSRRS